MSPPPVHAHQWRASFLAEQLRSQVPEGWHVITEMSLTLDEDFRVPDLLAHRWPLTTTTSYARYPLSAADVGLLLEVVSPRSRKTDRFLKPAEYAAAGIPVFWRLECEPALVLHPYVLVDGAYVPREPIATTGRAPLPWGDVDVDLTGLP